MTYFPPNAYDFAGFHFDANSLILYRGNEILKGPERQSLAVLAAILRTEDKFATHDEIIKDVWPDSKYGVDHSRVNQHISKLQKLLSKFEPEVEFFENLRGRGYKFLVPVTQPVSDPSGRHTSAPGPIESNAPRSYWKPAFIFALAVGFLSLTAFAIWSWIPRDETESVKQVVKESQMYESLVLYKHPDRFSDADLDKYWTAELDMSANFDRDRIKQSIHKLIDEGRKYGEETKCELFDFQSVDINSDRDRATVRTLEKWLIADYHVDGTLLKVKTVGPYFVDYLVRKVDGRWLIEKSTTARTVRPTPRIDEIKQITEPVAGQEFLVNVTGTDFEPVTVYLEVTGKGCPESKPCKVDNGALLERSKLSNKSLENVPLKLASGGFNIVVRNGDSKPSNPVMVTVP